MNVTVFLAQSPIRQFGFFSSIYLFRISAQGVALTYVFVSVLSPVFSRHL